MTFAHVDHGITLPQIDQINEPTRRLYRVPSGSKYPSVTTVLGATADHTWLDEWRANIGHKEADTITRVAGRRGSTLHKMWEDYVANREIPPDRMMPMNAIAFKQVTPILDAHVTNVWFQEAALYSSFLRTAGTVDLIAEYDSKLAIIDFKTSRSAKTREIITDYFQQEAFYAVAFEERTKIPITRLVTIIQCDYDAPQVFVESRDAHIKGFMSRRREYFKINNI